MAEPQFTLPFKQDLVFAATSDFSQTWVWQTAPSALGQGTPVDLTDYTAEAILYEVSETSPIVTITTSSSANGVITLGGTNGTVTVVLTHACTATLPTPLRWTLRVTSPDDIQTVLLFGTVKVLPVGPLP